MQSIFLLLLDTTHRHRNTSLFLGDAVLKLWQTRLLWDAHLDADKGELDSMRQKLESEAPLAHAARHLFFSNILDDLMEKHGRRQELSDSQLATAVEALVGACYLAHNGNPVLMEAVVASVTNMTRFNAKERAFLVMSALARAKVLKNRRVVDPSHTEEPRPMNIQSRTVMQTLYIQLVVFIVLFALLTVGFWAI
jgi:dsRNA-specific ribonuclease